MYFYLFGINTNPYFSFVARRSHQQRATFLNPGDGRLVLLPPRLGADFDVLRQTLVVEPGLAAVDVAHVEEALVGRIFRAAVAADDEDVV